MTKFLVLIVLCAVFMACDASKPSSNVVIPKKTPHTELTFENALELEKGKKYSFRPTGHAIGGNSPEDAISVLSWGNVANGLPIERKDLPENAPKVKVSFWLEPGIYLETPDGKEVIRLEAFLPDEVVVRITSDVFVTRETGGERGNKFRFNLVSYDAKPIENLTQPDIKFEYDYH